jgi:Mn2+/Fe2+ NRAMP family transporter
MNFSVVVLPSLLCLVPLIVTVESWRLEHGAQSTLSKARLVLFRVGLILSVLGLLITVSCYIDPYPLVHDPDGSLSNGWFDRAWIIAIATPIISMILSLFGRGWSRILLAVGGVLSLGLAYGSLLQNGH